MAYLYHSKTGDVVAVFEDGKVYKDIWRKQLLGTYKNEKIFLGKGIFKKQVGTYNGDIREFRMGSFGITYECKIGYVFGDNVYSGSEKKKSKIIAYFTDSDKFGAAAAALLAGMFSSSSQPDDIEV